MAGEMTKPARTKLKQNSSYPVNEFRKMYMIKWLKKLAASKIQINITILEPHDPRVKHTTAPTETIETVHVNRIRKSDFRFVSDLKTDHQGKKTEFHYTEEFRGGKWCFLSDTGSGNKDEAMKLHLKVVERGTLTPFVRKVVHWEGLSKEETNAWVGMQIKDEE